MEASIGHEKLIQSYYRRKWIAFIIHYVSQKDLQNAFESKYFVMKKGLRPTCARDTSDLAISLSTEKYCKGASKSGPSSCTDAHNIIHQLYSINM